MPDSDSRLVLLHPVGLDGRCWQFLDLSAAGEVIGYDLLWHGGRPKPEQPLSLASFATDVVESVPGPLDLVGLSMGGAVALEIALRYPDRVRSLMLACSSAGGRSSNAQEQRAQATEAGGMSAVLESTLTRWFSAAALGEPANPGVAYARRRLLDDEPAAFAAAWRALANNRAKERLHEISVPTTVLHATEDAAGAIEGKLELAAGIAGSRLRTVPGPHMVQLERPELFGPEVLDHLAWAREAGSRP